MVLITFVGMARHFFFVGYLSNFTISFRFCDKRYAQKFPCIKFGTEFSRKFL